MLLILIIIGIILLLTQKLWVGNVVNYILKYDTVKYNTVTNINQKTDNIPPSKNAKGLLEGSVTLSPTCPVERIPPDPGCAPRGYATDISIVNSALNKSVTTISSDASGYFRVLLPFGNYVLTPKGGTLLPRCDSLNVNINAVNIPKVNISCDTGIR